MVVGSITVGLPFAMGAQARTPGGRCAARFPEVIRDGFPEPAMRFSAHGQLRTTLRMSTGAVHVAGGRYTTETYEGTFPGPTLVICPGDEVTARVVNDMATKEPTNLHVHGLHVSPRGHGDNVFLEIPPGRSLTYHYRLPLDHWAGDTFSFVPVGEYAPHGSLSSATFTMDGDTAKALTLQFFDTQGLGTWTR